MWSLCRSRAVKSRGLLLRDSLNSGLVVLTVDNGITPYIVHGVPFVNPKPRLPNDNTNFTFIVQSFRELRMRINVFITSNDTRGPLGENNRMGCYVCQLCVNNSGY